jgi:C_GCAxxG_C_C family probable redox protein
VLASLQEYLNIGDESGFMAGSALAGGVARATETCGALTGALMGLGMVMGRKTIEDVDTYQACMKYAIELRKEFQKRVGNTICAEIHKGILGRSYRLKDDEERQKFHDAGGHSREACPGVCGKAARLAAEIILGEQEKTA